jgi:hypothetical protein
MMYLLLVDFLVLRVMIKYHIMILANCRATSDFCQHSMHDTSYDTPIVTSLRNIKQAICDGTLPTFLSVMLAIKFVVFPIIFSTLTIAYLCNLLWY